MPLRNRLSQTLTRYRDEERGSLVVPFAISLVLLAGGVGVAMDMSRVVGQKEKVQGVADAASLAAARSGEKGNGQLRKIADAVFVEHFGAGGDRMITSVKRDGDAVRVEASDTVPTTLSRLLGFDALDLSVESTSVYAERRMDIALVLDSTDSMSGSNMNALKRSANTFVDLIDEADTDKVRIGIAPYAQHVNVGTANRDAVWLEVPADRVTPSRYQCRMVRDVVSRSNCRTETRTGSRDGQPFTYTVNVCDTTYGDRYERCGWTRERVETWQGCVGSRDVPLDTKPAYDGVKIPGLLNKPCGAEILVPTDNLRRVRSAIDGLNPRGETYMPAGLIWGRRLLEASAPFPNSDPAPDGDRVMILMTDGQNTRSKSGDAHNGTDSVDADRKTAQLCREAKASGTTIYTIGYGVTDGATRSLLRDCASSTGHYFDARNADQLESAFEDIASSIKELRVSA